LRADESDDEVVGFLVEKVRDVPETRHGRDAYDFLLPFRIVVVGAFLFLFSFRTARFAAHLLRLIAFVSGAREGERERDKKVAGGDFF